MRNRRALLLVLATAALAVACGQPEQIVVDKYFGAVNQKDNDTLSSFAVVSLDQKVDHWSIVQSQPLSESPATLPDLIKKQKEIEDEVNQNKRKYQNYALDNPKEVGEVRDILAKGGKYPARLQKIGETWEKFIQTRKDLDKALAGAKDAADREKKIVMMSLGTEVPGVETLSGKSFTRQLDVTLTIAGQPKDYLMTLRRYELQLPPGTRAINRWIVTSLAPKG